MLFIVLFQRHPRRHSCPRRTQWKISWWSQNHCRVSGFDVGFFSLWMICGYSRQSRRWYSLTPRAQQLWFSRILFSREWSPWSSTIKRTASLAFTYFSLSKSTEVKVDCHKDRTQIIWCRLKIVIVKVLDSRYPHGAAVDIQLLNLKTGVFCGRAIKLEKIR